MDFSFLNTFLVFLFSSFFLIFLNTKLRSKEVLKEQPDKNLIVPRAFSLEELEAWDGIQKPLAFVAVKGVVYNVSLDFYGRGSPYNAFAGRDSSRHLAKVVVGRQEANADWTRLSQHHLSVLQDWEDKLRSKYAPVGWIKEAKDTFERNAVGLPP